MVKFNLSNDLSGDYVTCQLCGLTFRSLKPHMSRKHGITLFEYSQRFPRYPTIGKSTTLETSRAISHILTGRPKTQEHKDNLSKSNKEAYTKDPQLKQRTGEAISKANTGRIQSEDHNAAISAGIRRAHRLDPTYGIRSGEGQRLLWTNPKLRKERIAKMSKISKEQWKNPYFVEKMLKSRHSKPNQTEAALLELLERTFPNIWKYNGDGSYCYLLQNWNYKGRHIPDFIRIDGRKQVIYSNGYYWHPPEDEERQLKDCAKYGIKCFVVWADNQYQILSEWTKLEKALLEG